jgi:hypothetical protein
MRQLQACPWACSAPMSVNARMSGCFVTRAILGNRRIPPIANSGQFLEGIGGRGIGLSRGFWVGLQHQTLLRSSTFPAELQCSPATGNGTWGQSCGEYVLQRATEPPLRRAVRRKISLFSNDPSRKSARA